MNKKHVVAALTMQEANWMQYLAFCFLTLHHVLVTTFLDIFVISAMVTILNPSAGFLWPVPYK